METLSADSAITAAENDPLRDVKRKNAIKGAFFSEFIDMFDIYLPVIVLPPVCSISSHLIYRAAPLISWLHWSLSQPC